MKFCSVRGGAEMKYRLKDRELQKKLDEISDGDFTRTLESKSMTYAKEFDHYRNKVTVRVQFGERFHVFLGIDDVEPINEYDPKSWNPFPGVTPPEGVLMATEFNWSHDEIPCRSCWMFKDGKWHWMDGRECVVDYGWVNIKFRPWYE